MNKNPTLIAFSAALFFALGAISYEINQLWIFYVGLSVIALTLLLAALAAARRADNAPRYEQGYAIRRKSDGYPMTVGHVAAVKAIGTGDYEMEGVGEPVPIGQQYADERLN